MKHRSRCDLVSNYAKVALASFYLVKPDFTKETRAQKSSPGGELGKSKDKKQNEKACKIQKGLPSLKTNSLHLKMDGWNTSFLLG